VTALKFRGLRRSKRLLGEITEAALASYVSYHLSSRMEALTGLR
jgi:hypothetical protein